VLSREQGTLRMEMASDRLDGLEPNLNGCLARSHTLLQNQGPDVQLMVHRRVYSISSGKVSLGRLTSSLHWKAHMFVGAQRRARSTMAAMWSHNGGGRLNLCSCIDARS
jgi:hypothetical protein